MDFTNSTNSGLTPSCELIEGDVFYSHTVSSGDNQVTIGMSSTLAFATVNYQILLAPQGDTNNLSQIVCDSYASLLTGGFFEVIIDNVLPGDVYYLRAYKPGGLLTTVLDTLLNNTNVKMISEFNGTLSNTNTTQQQFKVFVKENKIELLNNINFFEYDIYGLDGKLYTKNDSKEALQSINISFLNKGIYILSLNGNKDTQSIKFVKY